MKLMPQEIEVWYILPAIRRDLASEMKKLNLNQKEIAVKLGLTGAAVSQYIKGKRGFDVNFNKKVEARIKKAAKNIINNKGCLIKEINDVCKLVKKEEILCKVHKEHTKLLRCCGVCLK